MLTATSAGDGSTITSNFDFSYQTAIITNVFATGYYCVYNSELPGSQTVTITILNNTYTLKSSFLFGGHGVAMQGTGKTAPDGDYVKYISGGGCFVHIAGRNAGRNLEGQWVINPQVLKERYARLGVTDFTGFGNLALLYPDRATFSTVSSVTGSSGQPLTPWSSIAVDASLIPLGQSFTLVFRNDAVLPYSATSSTFIANDTGGAIKGKYIDIYLGEGQSALNEWLRSGGNRYVEIQLR
jgi:3D (Asp-Asp-Asp) domain-containing protein